MTATAIEKILKEIDEEIERARKIMVEMPQDRLDQIANDTAESFILAYEECKKIIRKYMKDNWIPVERGLPDIGQRVQATIKHHAWIADYDADWVPAEEKTRNPEYLETCEAIRQKDGMWLYIRFEDGYEEDIAHINPRKDLAKPVAEVIAWCPMPEPYRPENSDSDCFVPEQDNPYPLCVGKGAPQCKTCCLYKDMEEPLDWREDIREPYQPARHNMTPQEAIEQLEFDRDMILFDPSTGEELTLERVKSLNKDNYMTYVADGMAIQALKKQVPRAPIKVSDSGVRYTDDYICPDCGKHFTGTGIAHFCYHCGQRLKWEGV